LNFPFFPSSPHFISTPSSTKVSFLYSLT
jgi:hypothetical protein